MQEPYKRIAYIKPQYMTRPSLDIEALGDEASGYRPGRQSWSAIEFEILLDLFDTIGFYDEVVLEYPNNYCELWRFKQARIARHPHQLRDEFPANRRAENPVRFIMIYDSAERLSQSFSSVEPCQSSNS